MTATDKAYEVITARIIESLGKGIVPWRKPWGLPPGVRPRNISGRAYSGINTVILGMSPYQDSRWLTFRKAKELGGNIRKGEKATPIVFWKSLERDVQNERGEWDTKAFFILKYFNVFNVEQTEGIPVKVNPDVTAFDAIEAAEAIIAGMPNPPSIAHDGGDRAYYRPATDEIHLPPRQAFADSGEYYSTAFHELGHSTGHSSRLNRHELETGIAPFGSPTYSKEELAAEFTSAFLCNESGIENTIENSTAYIQGWSRKIKSDPRLVVVAASQGQKATDYILSN
jgi:antirestriction protein ArdC